MADLPRLAEVLLDAGGEAAFELEFYLDEKRRACVRGGVRANLALECQRCLGPMNLPVETRMQGMFVRSMDEAQRVPDEFEPVLLEGEEHLRLNDLIEDDLLLALPQAPMHQPDECRPEWKEEARESAKEAPPVERENPFAVLSALKKETTTKT